MSGDVDTLAGTAANVPQTADAGWGHTWIDHYTNVPPVAMADVSSPGHTVRVNTPVTLTGSGSYDPDSFPAPAGVKSYGWTQTAGPSVALAGADSAAPSFTPTEPGGYTFRLVVNDGEDDSDEATSPERLGTVTVKAKSGGGSGGGGGGGGGGCSLTAGPTAAADALGWILPYLMLAGLGLAARLRHRTDKKRTATNL